MCIPNESDPQYLSSSFDLNGWARYKVNFYGTFFYPYQRVQTTRALDYVPCIVHGRDSLPWPLYDLVVVRHVDVCMYVCIVSPMSQTPIICQDPSI